MKHRHTFNVGQSITQSESKADAKLRFFKVKKYNVYIAFTKKQHVLKCAKADREYLDCKNTHLDILMSLNHNE